jgi:hypothetical protein
MSSLLSFSLFFSHSLSHLNTFEQLIDFLIAELFTKTSQDIAKFTSSDVAVSLLVKDLKSSNKLL